MPPLPSAVAPPSSPNRRLLPAFSRSPRCRSMEGRPRLRSERRPDPEPLALLPNCRCRRHCPASPPPPMGNLQGLHRPPCCPRPRAHLRYTEGMPPLPSRAWPLLRISRLTSCSFCCLACLQMWTSSTACVTQLDRNRIRGLELVTVEFNCLVCVMLLLCAWA